MVCTFIFKKKKERTVKNTLYHKSGDEHEAVKKLIQRKMLTDSANYISIKLILPALLSHSWQLSE